MPELFYIDANGNKCDESLHAELLQEDNPSVDLSACLISLRQLKRKRNTKMLNIMADNFEAKLRHLKENSPKKENDPIYRRFHKKYTDIVGAR